MPIQYAKDDAKRRIRLTVTDPITVTDLIGSVEHQLADGAWKYGLLVDLRAPLAPPSPTDMQSFGTRVSELVAAHGLRGPIAVVARDPRMVSAAQRHAFTAGKIESIEVFWDLDDGQRWLDERVRPDENAK